MLRIASLAGLAVATMLSSSAHGVVAYGRSIGITVTPDLGACARLELDQPVTGVGQFSAAGATFGPGTITGVVRGAVPILLTGQSRWDGCVLGGHAGATIGQAVYTLELHTAVDDRVDVVVCGVRSGAVTCA
jgi:hypothetical protein